MKKLLSAAVIISLLTQCGYAFYPERRGQQPSARVDWGVFALDTLGLFVFIIPGVIAFGVDITNSTIYLPNDNKSVTLNLKKARKVKVKGKPTEDTICATIREETGVVVDFKDSRMKVYREDKDGKQEVKAAEVKAGENKVVLTKDKTKEQD
jgi:hypothetical protein